MKRVGEPVPEAGVWPAVVVGAGAAGLMAGLFAARAGSPPLILESRPRPGAKIRISGGGRCNLLPSRLRLDDVHTRADPRLLRRLLHSWSLRQLTAFFERELGIALTEEPGGKVFPTSGSSAEVLAALLAAVDRSGARIRGRFRVEGLLPVEGEGGARFELASERGERLCCRRLVLATGGLAAPGTGSDGWGLELTRGLGHRIEPTHPALVPLLAPAGPWTGLAGVSLPVRLRAVRGEQELEAREGDLLFTHRGFSGPVVLDLSRHLTAPEAEGVALRARWLGAGAPDWMERLLAGGRKGVGPLLSRHLPRRLAQVLCSIAEVPADRKLSELARVERGRLIRALTDCELPVVGDEGYRKAEVTAGGVALDEVDPASLESRRLPGLHLAGEILDATGRIGGCNFLWAWVSGRLAGEGLAAGLASDGA